MDPLVFHPYLRPQVWGARRLANLGKRSHGDLPIGEAWEISVHPHHVSVVAEGPFAGRSLADLWASDGEVILGRPPERSFPLLIKWLDCHQQLSVQVHPDDDVAWQLLGEEQGKTEAWVVVEADPSARIYAGLKSGITREDLERHLDQGTVADCLHSFVPKPGDAIFLPAGTVHAVGGGVLMAEVQQTSDATFRLFDWNRLGSDGKPRALHRAQSLAAIRWDAGPVHPIAPRSPETNATEHQCETLVSDRYFQLRRHRATQSFPVQAGVMSIWMVLEGSGTLSGQTGYERHCKRGDTLLISASSKPLAWRVDQGKTLGVLEITIPSSEQFSNRSPR